MLPWDQGSDHLRSQSKLEEVPGFQGPLSCFHCLQFLGSLSWPGEARGTCLVTPFSRNLRSALSCPHEARLWGPVLKTLLWKLHRSSLSSVRVPGILPTHGKLLSELMKRHFLLSTDALQILPLLFPLPDWSCGPTACEMAFLFSKEVITWTVSDH